MASPLEVLPTEILDCILEYLINHDIGGLRASDHLDCTSLSRLSQCSRFLNRRLEPLLYGTLDARNAALRNGCKTGNLHAIRKAASYGADPGVVRRFRLHICNEVVVEVSSLQVALKAGQLEAFNLLLDLGAGLPIPAQNYRDYKIVDSQLEAFAKRLAKPSNEAFLRAFVDARAETPYSKDGRRDDYSQAQAVVSRLPFPHVVRWASPALLETLLDNGAPLDRILMLSYLGPVKDLPLTALSMACLRGDIDVFNVLAARGAQDNIEDSLHRQYPTKYIHIPIFMAAHYMADTGNTDMLDACIANGADVNRPGYVHKALCPEHCSQPSQPHVCTTPLLTYLGLIKSWDTAPASSDGFATRFLTPVEGVAHFIHALGGNVSSPIAPPIKRQYIGSAKQRWDRNFAGVPSPVELLLVKWGIESLALPGFFSVIKLLVEHGGTGPDLAKILVRLEGQNEASDSDDIVDVETLWQQFLTLLTPQLEGLDQIDKNALLRRIMVDRAGMRKQVAYPFRWEKVLAIGRASISAVIRAGADINDVEGVSLEWAPPTSTPRPALKTPLHELISAFVHTDLFIEHFLHDHPRGHACAYTSDVVQSFGDFLAFLVSEGADPLVEDTNKGREDEKTAIDTLMSPLKTGRVEYEGGTIEKGLMQFVARLLGASCVPEYTGERIQSYRWVRLPYEECEV